MTKKLVLVAFVITFVAGLSACGKKGDVNPPKQNSQLGTD